jgi:putative ABC transport system permease protein
MIATMGLHTILRDLRFSLRSLARNPSFTLAALFTLALGIGANSAIFTVVNSVVLRPLPYGEPDRLAAVWLQSQPMGVSRLPFTDAEYFFYRDGSGGLLADLAVTARGQVDLSEAGEPERLDAAYSSANLLDVLRVEPALGHYFSPEQDSPGAEPVAVLGHGLWQRRFGGRADVLGSTVRLGGERYTVVGVLPPSVAYPSPEVEVWLPLQLDPLDLDPANRRLDGLARLRPGIEPAAAERQSVALTLGLADRYPEFFPRATLEQVELGLEVVELREALIGEVRTAMLVLLGAVGLVLLIACANIAGLLLARGEARKTEFVVRGAVGARRGVLLRQQLAESLLLGVAGGVLGLLLAIGCLAVIEAVQPPQIPRLQEIHLDPGSVAFTFAISLLTALAAGLVPALRASRPDLQSALRESGRAGAGPRQRVLRWTFVVSEVTLACILLIAAGLLLRSFWRLQQVDPGYRLEGVLTARLVLPAARYPQRQDVVSFDRRLLEGVAALPGVEAAALVNDLPLSGDSSETSFEIEGRPPLEGEPPRNAAFRVVTPGYFELMAIPLAEGRAFTPADSETATGAIIVDRTLARRFWAAGESPLGRRLRVPGADDAWRVVVGVAEPVRHDGLQAEPVPTLYLPQAQMAYSPALGGWRSMTLLLATSGAPNAPIPALRGLFADLDPELPLSAVRTLEQVAGESIARTSFTSLLLSAFAAAALLLAAIGLYGVLSYLTVRRRHEFGIRLALGADRRDVLRLVLGGALQMVLAGTAAGLVGAVLLNRFLRTLLFEVAVTDPATYVAVPAVLLLTGLIAALLPALRAVRTEPMEALHYE